MSAIENTRDEYVICIDDKMYVGRNIGNKVYAFNAIPDPSRPDDRVDAQIIIDPTTGKESFAGIFDGESIIPAADAVEFEKAPALALEEVPASEFEETPPEEISVDVSEMADLELKCPYLDCALEFAKNSNSATVGIDADLTGLMKLTTSGFITKCKGKFMISPDELIRIMVKNMLWTKSPGIDDMCLPFMIKYNMYEEFQNIVFSKLNHKDSIEWCKTNKPSAEFMMAYPFLNADHETFLELVLVTDPAQAMLMIIHGATVSNVSTDGYTALIRACMYSKKGVALAILSTESQGLPDHVGPKGKTAIMYAIERGLLEITKAIIATGKANLPYVSSTGKTALMYACTRPRDEFADAILAVDGSTVDYVNPIDECTALMYACEHYLESIALKIIRRGKGKPEHVTKKGLTALIISCCKELTHVALAIIMTGNANVDQISSLTGNTALIWACKQAKPAIATAILATGDGLPKHINYVGKTALYFARKKGMSDICTLLESM